MNMTSIYLSGSIAVQTEHNGISSRMTSWIRQKFADHRVRKAKLQTIRYLRGFDRATLDDIGLDTPSPQVPICDEFALK